MTDGRGVASDAVSGTTGGVEVIRLPGVVLHMDEESPDFHITAAPGHAPEHLSRVLDIADARELALLDLDECEPTLLEDSSVRLYLKSIKPAA
ncbi:hypothetical protein [Streptomyces variabilis]